jgi:ketosteroid isomerase-like protein
MAAAGDNLARVVSAWLAVLRQGDTKELAALLDPDVVWQGVTPELVCRTRDEVLDIMVLNRRRPPRITRVEAEEHGELVAIMVSGPDFPDTDFHAADAPRSLVFTFRRGIVTRIDSFPTTEAALAIARG